MDPPTRHSSRFRPLLTGGVVFAAILPHLYKLTLPAQELFSGFFPDDAFYYYKTAINIRNGLGPTFDGVNVTNGFHPLWMAICTCVAFITQDPDLYLLLVLLANLGLVMLVSVTLLRQFGPQLGPVFTALLLFAVNWHFYTGTALFSGLETPLYVALVLVTVHRITRASPEEPKQMAGAGLLVALAFLARTEFVLFLPVAAVYGLIRIRREGVRPRPAALAAFVLPSLILVGPYLAWNYSLTGHLQQVSGLVKDFTYAGSIDSSTNLVQTATKYARHIPVFLFSRRLDLLVWTLLAVTVLAAWRRPAILRPFKDPRLILLGIFSAVTVLYYMASYGLEFRPWHLAVAMVTFQLGFVLALRSAWSVLRQATPLKWGFIVLVAVIWTFYLVQVPQFQQRYERTHYHFIAPVHYHHEAAEWLREHLPEEKTVGMWNAGYVGYFSHRKVINLDGLINGRELYEYLTHGPGVWQYILDKKIDYISDYYFGPPQPPRSPIGDRLTLVHNVRRSPIMLGGEETYVDWYVWKVNHEAGDAVDVEDPGRWRPLPLRDDADDLDPELREAMARLEAIGYVSGSREVESDAVITRHVREQVAPGLNFFTSGHAPAAFLMDSDGTILHEWRHEFARAWPGAQDPRDREIEDFWRRAYLMEDGDVLAIFEGFGLIKVDKSSNLLWAVANQAHHDLAFGPEGEIYLLTRKAHVVPRLGVSTPVLEDFVVVLDSEGRELRRVSLLECLENSEFAGLLTDEVIRWEDLFHTNSIELLDGSFAEYDASLTAGRVLISIFRMNLVAVVDLDEETIVRGWSGDFRGQHDPKLVEDGGILIFDNFGLGERSRVLEIAAEDGSERWSFAGSEEIPFYSESCGTAQRLPNGNTLVTESDGGRAFELTPGGQLVWEFYNPNRAGEQQEYIATLFEMLRLPAGFDTGWLSEPGSSGSQPR
jgi:hypothetical protein